MKRTPRIALAIALTTLAACSAQAPPATTPDSGVVELRLRMHEGQRVRVRMTTEQSSSTTMMGRQMDSTQMMVTGISMVVRSVDADGSAMVETTYESLRFVADGPMGATEYDSSETTGEAPMAARPMAAMLGRAFTMRLSATGEVSELRGLEAIREAVLGTMDLPDEIAEQLREGLGRFLSDDSLAGMTELMTKVYPDGAVAIGDSWAGGGTVQLPFALHVENTYTLRERRAGVSFVDLHSAIGAGPPAVMEVGPMRMQYDVEGEQTGALEIDESTGWIVRSRIEGDFAGTMTMEGMAGMPEGISTPISAHSVTTIERLPDDRPAARSDAR